MKQLKLSDFRTQWETQKNKSILLFDLYAMLNEIERKNRLLLSSPKEIQKNPHSKYHLLISLASK
jgi:hypothetical protein